MDYLLLIVSSALFGGMFVFQQMYTRSEGSLLRATLVFGLLTGLMRFPLTFVLYGTNYTFHLTGVVWLYCMRLSESARRYSAPKRSA